MHFNDYQGMSEIYIYFTHLIELVLWQHCDSIGEVRLGEKTKYGFKGISENTQGFHPIVEKTKQRLKGISDETQGSQPIVEKTKQRLRLDGIIKEQVCDVEAMGEEGKAKHYEVIEGKVSCSE